MSKITNIKWVREILQENIDFNGVRTEVDVAIEEMAELTKELCKHRRGSLNILNIAEEIADVQIMLEQLTMIFGCGEIVAEQLDAKIARIARNLRKAEGSEACERQSQTK